MESVVDVLPSWDIFPEVGRKAFQNMRSEGGEEMVLKKNFFVRKLSEPVLKLPKQYSWFSKQNWGFNFCEKKVSFNVAPWFLDHGIVFQDTLSLTP